MKYKSELLWYRRVILYLLSLVSMLIFISASPVTAQEQEQKQEVYFISPGLQLGLHTKASLESPIKKLIASGNSVEVIKAKEQFSQIKMQDGTKGWIKSRFLTQNEPAIRKVEKLEKALQDALTKNKFLSASIAETPGTDSENLSSEKSLSDKEIEAYKETIAALKEELKAWEQLDYQDKQAQKVQAEKVNQQLRQRLSMIASLAMGEEVSSEQFDVSTVIKIPEIIDDSGHNILTLIKKNYLLLMMVAGVSFLLGILVMDIFNRRRHGGYRV